MNEAFKRLMHQQVKLKPGMDLMVLNAQIGKEQAKINVIEEELMRIAQTADEVIAQQYGAGGGHAAREKGWRRGTALDGSASSEYLLNRQKFLIRLMQDSHEKIVGFDEKRRKCEKEIKAIKKVD